MRWKALMLYFTPIGVPKYVHTTGTLYAHIRHTAGTAFLEIFEKIDDVPFVCHMCAHTWGASGMLKTEKYGQFPVERSP